MWRRLRMLSHTFAMIVVINAKKNKNLTQSVLFISSNIFYNTPMRVRQIFTDSPLRNYTYLVENVQGGFYCIDPWDGTQVIQHLQGEKLLGVINTHEHGDHTRGNRELVEKYDCPVFAHRKGCGKIAEANRFVSKGDHISLGRDEHLHIMDTPGHTFAHLCCLLVGRGKPLGVFTGDTLFNAGVGNCHNGGNPKVLFESVSRQLANLPDSVLLYPGHEYMGNNLRFTLDREAGNCSARRLLEQWQKVDFLKQSMVNNMRTEREVNTFLRLESREVAENLPGNPTTPEQVFLALRTLRDKW